VTERLGIGPDDCQEVNPRLIYARMTGWGQHGPLAQRAGHDINYLSLTGALHAMGSPGEPPPVPLNLIGDFGGGSMFLVVGILTALLERHATGRGRVVDVAMVDGVAALEQPLLSMRESGTWRDRRGANLIDGGAPFYRTYECADGRYVAVGAIEPQFFAALVNGLGLDPATVPAQFDTNGWPAMQRLFADTFCTRNRDAWAAMFADVDACVTPVLDFAEAPRHPHLQARATFDESSTMTRANPAPRFAAEPLPLPGPVRNVEMDDVIARWDMTR
jgi:alpha-methylacyl-CoA racemase